MTWMTRDLPKCLLVKNSICLRFTRVLGNIKGWLWFFVSFRIFFSDNTRVRIFILFVARSANFFPEFNIRLYDKIYESDYFFFLRQNQNILFSNIGNQNIFLEKNHNPPFKINGRSLSRSKKASNINFIWILNKCVFTALHVAL